MRDDSTYPPKLPILLFVPPGVPEAPTPHPLEPPKAIPRIPIPIRATPWTSYVIRARDDEAAATGRGARNKTVPREAAGVVPQGINALPPVKQQVTSRKPSK
jgi:hypothetical protein